MNCRKIAGMMPALMCVLMSASCGMEETSGGGVSGSGQMVTVGFTLSDAENLGSKGPDEGALSSLKILAYSDGVLLESAYYEEFSGMSLSLEKGRSYDLYALAGMGDIAVPSDEADIADFRYRVTGYEYIVEGLPMCWERSGYLPDSQSSVVISLTRLVSKVFLSVDTGDTGLKVSSAAVRQMPLSVCPFPVFGSRAEDGDVGDHVDTSGETLDNLNNGGRAVFYVLENMQGTLMPGNTDPMLKVPARLDSQGSVCTYVEVGCRFPDGYDKEGTAVYRVCLGKDALTNFDLERNEILDVSLLLTNDGLSVTGSWKITSDYVQHAVRIDVSDAALDMIVGNKKSLAASVWPSDALETAIGWTSSDQSVVTVYGDGTLHAVGNGSCVVRAYCKERPQVWTDINVTVSDKVISMHCTPAQVSAVLGQNGETRYSDFKVTAVYASGKECDVTDVSSYSSDSPSVEVETGGVLHHLSSGTAVITISYDGAGTELKAVTEDFKAVAVEMEHDRYVISLGETASVRYRVLYNDGTASGFVGYQLAQGPGWSCEGMSLSDWSLADVSVSGKVSAFTTGQTTVTVSVWSIGLQESMSASAVLTVNEAYLVSLYAEATPMFYDGIGGPSLTGIYSDGTERDLTGVASWTTSHADVTFSYSSGLSIADESSLSAGSTVVTFTGSFQGMSASASSLYGKWTKGVRLDKTVETSSSVRYRMALIYDDFSVTYVPFEYQTSDGGSWSQSHLASESGVVLPVTNPTTRIRAVTADEYHDYTGAKTRYSIGY